MVKLKPLLPTLKEKKRYLVYEVLSDKKINSNLSVEILSQVKNTLGLFDSAKAGLQNIKYDDKTLKGVMRVNNKEVDKLKTSLAIISSLKDSEVIVRSIGVSGILKKAKNKYMAG